MSLSKYLDMEERKPQRLIILEGPDCAGKTTLATELAKTQSMYKKIHHGPFPRVTAAQLPRLYLESMQPMLDWWHGLIMDRSWLSEQVYGPVFRNANRVSRLAQRHLERIAMRHGAVVVLCLPPWEAVRQKWAERKGLDPKAEMLENEDQLRAVWDGYNNLQTELPVIRYDYTQHASGSLWSSRLMGEVNRIGSRCHEWTAKTVGNLHSKVILVGDKPSELTDYDSLTQWPFCSFSNQGSSLWLTKQLENAGIPESDLMWVNQSSGLSWIERVYNRPVIALGSEAALRLTQLRSIRTVVHEVPHPQHHKRFRSSEEYPLIPLLKKLI